MKAGRLVAFTLSAFIVALPLAAQQGRRSPSADSAAVVALEHAWLAAQHDSAALDTILAPDFVHALGSGQFINKSEHIGFLVAHPAPSTAHVRFERLDVRILGATAIATGIVDATQDGAPGVKRTVFTDAFVRRHGHWQAVSAQETPIA